MKQITVQLVDDHEMVRTAFRYMLESVEHIKIVAESGDGLSAIADYARVKPDVVLMDVLMHGMGGLDAVRHILARTPDARIIVLSMMGSEIAVRAMKAGAKGYLSKSSKASEMHAAIRRVMNGKTYIDIETAQDLAANPNRDGNPLSLLSAREFEVFVHLANGVSINVIASYCCLSPKTVRSHKSNIMHKLKVNNMVGFVRLAMQSGLITDTPISGTMAD